MSTTTQDAFETALADVFEGREVRLGHGPRKLLREFYDRALKDAAKAQTSKIGQSVRDFSELQVGDVFQNSYLRGENRCRRVVRVISKNTVETEFVSTRSKRIVRTETFGRDTFENYNNYQYITDPAKP